MNIIAKQDRSAVRQAGAANLLAGTLVKLVAGQVIPLAGINETIYGVTLDAAAAIGDDVPVLRYPFFTVTPRIRATGAIAKDAALEPKPGGHLGAGATRPIFQAEEAMVDDAGTGQHLAVVQIAL